MAKLDDGWPHAFESPVTRADATCAQLKDRDSRWQRWPGHHDPDLRAPWWREVVLLAALYGVYDAIRGVIAGSPAKAEHDGGDLLHVEQLSHLDPEHWINNIFQHVAVLAVPACFFYATLHFVITPSVLIWAHLARPAAYRRARTVLAGITAIALLGFWLFPTAPPRLLAGAGFHDTLAVYSTWGWPAPDYGPPYRASSASPTGPLLVRPPKCRIAHQARRSHPESLRRRCRRPCSRTLRSLDCRTVYFGRPTGTTKAAITAVPLLQVAVEHIAAVAKFAKSVTHQAGTESPCIATVRSPSAPSPTAVARRRWTTPVPRHPRCPGLRRRIGSLDGEARSNTVIAGSGGRSSFRCAVKWAPSNSSGSDAPAHPAQTSLRGCRLPSLAGPGRSIDSCRRGSPPRAPPLWTA